MYPGSSPVQLVKWLLVALFEILRCFPELPPPPFL